MHTYIITSIQSTKQPPSVLSFADVGQPIETPSPLKTNRTRTRTVYCTSAIGHYTNKGVGGGGGGGGHGIKQSKRRNKPGGGGGGH